MASACGALPSVESTCFLKWMLLLVDGGTLVLREYFNRLCPPQQLAQLLRQKTGQLKILLNKGIITPLQNELLFPQQGIPNSNAFDISLLTCLLRYVSGLNSTSIAWKGIPSPTDLSTEADIARLRVYRNECAHSTMAYMTERTFKTKWTNLEQVLLRLGTGIPGLKAFIDTIGTQSIDPAREKELQDQIETWENIDEEIQKDIQELRYTMQSHWNTINTLNKDSNICKNKLDKYVRKALKNNRSIIKLKARVSATEIRQRRINYVTKKDIVKKYFEINAKEILRVTELERIKTKMSPEMVALVSNTVLYMEDILADCPYVETLSYQKAKNIITQHNILVISGHPGEGKTTMAAKLMSEISSSERCLKMREPSDWKYFDVGLGNIDVLFADDMFGSGSMDDRLVKEWEKFLSDIYRATQRRNIKVILTTRQSILEEAKDILEHSRVFDDKHIILLSSENLLDCEKYDIVKVHLQKNRRSFQNELIRDCINASGEFFETKTGLTSTGIVFGFPQCVTMFSNNDSFFKQKGHFFSEPAAFFRRYIENLLRNEEKFLPLILIWSRPEKHLLFPELDLSSTSHELTRIAKKFGFALKPKLIKTVRKSLSVQKGSFVVYTPRTGGYTFSHYIIGDLIGLIVGEKYPEASLDVSSRDFIVNYATVDDKKCDQGHFFIQSYLFKQLSEKLVFLFLNPRLPFSGSALKRLQRQGNCPNKITPENHIDASLIFIDAFKNGNFISVFIHTLEDERHRESAIKLLSLPVIKMSGYFLGRGVSTEDTVLFLPEFLLLYGRSLLLEQLIRSGTNLKLGIDKHDIGLSLMIATHMRKKNCVQVLLEQGAAISEEVIYIAAMTEDIELLKMLLEKRKPISGKKSRICNGNNALTASAKKGLTSSVQCLIDCGEDINFRNSNNCNALGKAIIYKNVDVCKILINAGSPLNVCIGEFKRTPLHIACDVGLTDIVRYMIENGASPNVKDSKGHFPIHCAAFRNNIGVLKVLLEHDLTMAKKRIVSFRKRSCVKGMTVFHIAIIKRHYDLMDMLVEMKADPNVTDYYGRTPLLYAVSVRSLLLTTLVHVSDINKADKQGLTPLHMAMLKKIEPYQRSYLLSKDDLNINAIDNRGRTPLHIAFKRGLIKTGIELILSYKADLRMVTKDGSSIFHILEKKAKFRETFYVMDYSDRFPQIDFKENGKITHEQLLSLLKLIDPRYKHYTQDLQL